MLRRVTTSRRFLGLLTALLALFLTTGQAAQAASVTVRDARNDAFGYTVTDSHSGASTTPVRTPGPVGDILWARTTHSTKGVTVNVRARALSDDTNELDVHIKTPGHRGFLVLGETFGGRGTGTLWILRGVNGSRRQVTCDGAKVRVDGPRGILRVHVPRSCLGDPRWVRTAVSVASVSWSTGSSSATNTDTQTGTVDAAGLDGIPENAAAPFSRKVRVG
jgi:hypothetical protein